MTRAEVSPSATFTATPRMTLAILTLERTHAGFARVVLDDLLDRLVGDLELLRREAVLFELLRDQVLPRDRELLVPRVAGDLEDLHAVAEGRRDRIGDVGGRDEHHVREVVRDLEVVIGEGVVLLGVEHLEQRRARVAAEVVPDLVDLIHHEDRVDGPDFFMPWMIWPGSAPT